MEGGSTVVSVKGSYNYVEKTASVAVQAKLKGRVGLETAIVSKIFELRGEGPVDHMRWKM